MCYRYRALDKNVTRSMYLLPSTTLEWHRHQREWTSPDLLHIVLRLLDKKNLEFSNFNYLVDRVHRLVWFTPQF